MTPSTSLQRQPLTLTTRKFTRNGLLSLGFSVLLILSTTWSLVGTHWSILVATSSSSSSSASSSLSILPSSSSLVSSSVLSENDHRSDWTSEKTSNHLPLAMAPEAQELAFVAAAGANYESNRDPKKINNNNNNKIPRKITKKNDGHHQHHNPKRPNQSAQKATQENHPPPPNQNNNNNGDSSKHHSNQTYDTLAACLLIKDDNDILNEWIAYHYHTWNLRHLIVAVDPSSKTSPSQVLEHWKKESSPPFFDMDILEWTDQDYMPDYFLQGRYDQVPSFLPAFIRENVSASIWHQRPNQQQELQQQQNEEDPASTTSSTTHSTRLSKEDIQADLVTINNHRFRQVTFVSHCFKRFKSDHRVWVAHVDTDEYMVINPRLRIRPKAVSKIHLPTMIHAGSLLQFLNDMFRYYPKRLFRSCVMMPTLLFGAKENNNVTLLQKLPPEGGWNRSRFETLRWTYHAGWNEIANGLPKAIVDVSTLPWDHPIFANQMIKSVHQPLESKIITVEMEAESSGGGGTTAQSTRSFKQICRHMTLKPNRDEVRLYPFTIHHYVGSLERYLARQDLRRNIQIYQQKAKVQDHVDDGWIQSWLASFVETHGLNATRKVLGDYLLQ